MYEIINSYVRNVRIHQFLHTKWCTKCTKSIKFHFSCVQNYNWAWIYSITLAFSGIYKYVCSIYVHKTTELSRVCIFLLHKQKLPSFIGLHRRVFFSHPLGNPKIGRTLVKLHFWCAPKSCCKRVKILLMAGSISKTGWGAGHYRVLETYGA